MVEFNNEIKKRTLHIYNKDTRYVAITSPLLRIRGELSFKEKLLKVTQIKLIYSNRIVRKWASSNDHRAPASTETSGRLQCTSASRDHFQIQSITCNVQSRLARLDMTELFITSVNFNLLPFAAPTTKLGEKCANAH